MSKKKTLIVEYSEFDKLNELSKGDFELVVEARNALMTSYSPYSKFKVAAAIRFSDGEILCGSNQENIAYPEGLCAERVALFAAGADKQQRNIEAIAVVAQKEGKYVACLPCGACLQVMLETEKRTKSLLDILISLGDEKFMKIEGVKNLLPFSFREF